MKELKISKLAYYFSNFEKSTNIQTIDALKGEQSSQQKDLKQKEESQYFFVNRVRSNFFSFIEDLIKFQITSCFLRFQKKIKKLGEILRKQDQKKFKASRQDDQRQNILKDFFFFYILQISERKKFLFKEKSCSYKNAQTMTRNTSKSILLTIIISQFDPLPKFQISWQVFEFNYYFHSVCELIRRKKMMEDNNMQFLSSFQGTYSSNECFTLQMPFQNVVEELQKSESLLCNFVNQLEDKAHTSISNVMYSFCQKYRSFQISGSELQNLVNKRIQRMIKNKRIKRNWNREDEKIIVWVLSKYMERHSINSISNLKEQHWEEISSLIPGSTPNTCMFKILSMKKVKLAAKKWSQQEEKILIKLVEEQLKQSSKKKWKLISQRLFLENEEEGKIYRDPKQCKQHWNCHLNPELKKGPWTTQDDARFLKYIRDNNGKKRWVQMIKVFPTRTQNSLKNRYVLLMNQLKKKYPKKNGEKERISSFLNKIDSDNRNIQINRIKEKEKKKIGKSLTDEEENRDLTNKSKILPLDLSQPQECPFQLNYQEPNFMTTSPQQQYSYMVCWYVPNIFYLSQ